MNKHIEAFVNLVRLARITGTDLTITLHGDGPGQPVAVTAGVPFHSAIRVEGHDNVATALRRSADIVDGKAG